MVHYRFHHLVSLRISDPDRSRKNVHCDSSVSNFTNPSPVQFETFLPNAQVDQSHSPRDVGPEIDPHFTTHSTDCCDVDGGTHIRLFMVLRWIHPLRGHHRGL